MGKLFIMMLLKIRTPERSVSAPLELTVSNYQMVSDPPEGHKEKRSDVRRHIHAPGHGS
jgi:hypothetical protein